MIERQGRDVTVTQRDEIFNKYDDAEIASSSSRTIKGIVKPLEENRNVEREGRTVTVEVELLIPSSEDITIVGEGVPDKISFTYNGEERNFKAVERITSPHPYNRIEKKKIGLKEIQDGAELDEALT